jgi:hypothetical protein
LKSAAAIIQYELENNVTETEGKTSKYTATVTQLVFKTDST